MRSNTKPKVIIIAGPNGSGKSTASAFLLKDVLDVLEFVNADVIASGLSGFNPEGAAITAGRVMLHKVRELASLKKSFAFESTLSGKSYLPFLEGLKKSGYEINIYYLWLQNPQLAIKRVDIRVRSGGHSIPEKTIVQRYYRSIRNFVHDYAKLCTVGRCWTILQKADRI